mgnify:CR=1 FL=1
MSFDIVIDGLEELRGKMERFPDEAKNEGGNMVGTYVWNVMREYQPYAYVPFKAAYGDWFSEKQRKYVMAAIREGKIGAGSPHRSGHLREGWKKLGEGSDQLIYNDVPYAGFVMGDGAQARMHIKIGWITAGQRLKERAGEIERKAKAGVDKAIKKLGL